MTARPPRVLLASFAAAGSLTCTVPAVAAPLGVQDDRLTSGPVEQTASRIGLLRDSGAKVTRLDVLWSLVAPTRPKAPEDPGDPAYRWDRTDAALRGIAGIGVTPVVVTYSAPPWAADGRPIPAGTEVNSSSPVPAEFAHFMTALARRYSGSHTPPGAAGPLPRVRHFELWNEPNLGRFLSPQVVGGRRVVIGRYAEMTRLAYAAIKRVQPSAIVLAGAGGPRSSTDARGTGAEAWARAVASSDARFDAYSQHVYPAAPPTATVRAFPSWSTLPRLLAALDRVPGRRGTPVYITEAGYTTAVTPFRTVRVSRAQQARYLRQIAALPIVRNPRVRAVIWFNLQDNPDWPGGLRNLGGRPKPSLAVFRSLARASRLTADLRVRPAVTLSRTQLLVNQRISQAAIRRLTLLHRRLDAGLGRDDLRPGGVGAVSFAPDVIVTVGPPGTATPGAPLQRRALVPTAPVRRAGAATAVRLTASQVLINQRVSQAAVRRANGLAARLTAGLTGGDLREGAIDAARLARGVAIAGVHPGAPPVPPTTTRVAAPSRVGGVRIALTARQLGINQRISQAAVRRANALATKLAEGLTSADLRAGSLGAPSLDPSLRETSPSG